MAKTRGYVTIRLSVDYDSHMSHYKVGQQIKKRVRDMLGEGFFLYSKVDGETIEEYGKVVKSHIDVDWS